MGDLAKYAHPKPSTLERTQRDATVAALRRSGRTVREIADELGMEERAVYASWRRSNALAKEHLAELAQDCLVRDLDAIDALWQSRWDAALSGNDDAFDRIVKLMELRARWLEYGKGGDEDTREIVINIGPRMGDGPRIVENGEGQK